MNNQELFECFKEHLTEKLASEITYEFQSDFMRKVEEKKDGLYLKGEELAVNMAMFCNLAGKLSFPMYFEEQIPVVKYDLALSHITDEMLEYMDSIIKGGRFAVYKIEADKTDKGMNRLKFHYYLAADKGQAKCDMLCNYNGDIVNKNNITEKVITPNWFRMAEDKSIVWHYHDDMKIESKDKVCQRHYCVNRTICFYYYIRYILNNIDIYIKERENYLSGIKPLDLKNIQNYQKLIEQIKNPRQKHLYVFLEGEEGLNQNEICKEIARLLWKEEKVTRINYFNYTMINCADSMAKNTEGIKYEYKRFEIDQLYVLSGIDEFVKGSKIQNDIAYEKKCAHLIKLLSEIMEKRYVIILGSEESKKSFFSLSGEIKFIFKPNVYKICNLKPEEMYEEFCKQTKYQNLLTPEFKEEFLEYIALNHDSQPIKNQQLVKYLVNYCDMKGQLVLPESRYRKEDVDERLKDIIGLYNVKETIKEFKDYVLFLQKAKAHGNKIEKSNFHMIYTGNPGTGKTTIARIMASMLYQLGVVKEDKLIEVERKDLVGQYIGQTAPKTADVITKAMGGVLFIDEAYTLSVGGSNDFGKEAIATLIKAMEDHSDELVVIFAGYLKEMDDFLSINPGIASRIGYNFDFPDYTVEELVEIYVLSMKKMGFAVADEIKPDILKIMEYFSRLENFGNGRFVKKYIQETLINHSQLNPNNYDRIFKEDLPDINKMSTMLSLKQSKRELEYDKESLYSIAIHEGGHAFVDYKLKGKVNIDKIVLDSKNGNNPGYVSFVKDDTSIFRRSDYIRLIKTALAGMCAEIVFFGEPSDGNSHDLREASRIINIMVTRIGSFDDMLLVTDTITIKKEDYMNRMLNQYYQETLTLIRENKDTIELLARTLIERKELSAEDFSKLVGVGNED